MLPATHHLEELSKHDVIPHCVIAARAIIIHRRRALCHVLDLWRVHGFLLDLCAFAGRGLGEFPSPWRSGVCVNCLLFDTTGLAVVSEIRG